MHQIAQIKKDSSKKEVIGITHNVHKCLSDACSNLKRHRFDWTFLLKMKKNII